MTSFNGKLPNICFFKLKYILAFCNHVRFHDRPGVEINTEIFPGSLIF